MTLLAGSRHILDPDAVYQVAVRQLRKDVITGNLVAKVGPWWLRIAPIVTTVPMTAAQIRAVIAGEQPTIVPALAGHRIVIDELDLIGQRVSYHYEPVPPPPVADIPQPVWHVGPNQDQCPYCGEVTLGRPAAHHKPSCVHLPSPAVSAAHRQLLNL